MVGPGRVLLLGHSGTLVKSLVCFVCSFRIMVVMALLFNKRSLTAQRTLMPTLYSIWVLSTLWLLLSCYPSGILGFKSVSVLAFCFSARLPFLLLATFQSAN